MRREILIVGMGEIGASIGLAIRRGERDLVCTGYDADTSTARAARKAGAVERLGLGLARSVGPADLVILALPSGQVRGYLEAIGPRLKPGALVLDTSWLKSAAVDWASEILPEGRYYVGAVPTVSPDALHRGALGANEPRPDLFEGGVIAMVIPARTPEPVVDLALRVAAWLGAEPFFVDPAEVDALTATVEDLPVLLGTTLMRVAMRSPGWREARRMAGRFFATSAIVGALQAPSDLQAGLALNRPNVLTRLDAAIGELQAMRALIAQGDEEGLEKCLAEAVEAHYIWLAARSRGDWAREEIGPVEMPRGGVLDRLLGIGGDLRARDRRRGDDRRP
jgi:prephenate dehydrogenase